MEQPNPATPAQAATPGNGAAVATPPSVVTPAANTPAAGGKPEEGKVMITTKEYGELQRAKARTLAFDRRKNLFERKNNSNGTPNPGDPSNEDKIRADQAEHRALQLEVKDQVRDILAKPEYAALPQSTRDLILKNPAMLSEADNVEEALLDVEEFVIEQVSKLSSNAPGGGASPATTVPGHDAPPVSPNSPAPVKNDDVEDISKLSGPARSRAILRNNIRAKRLGAK